jgi:hypothetical protein
MDGVCRELLLVVVDALEALPSPDSARRPLPLPPVPPGTRRDRAFSATYINAYRFEELRLILARPDLTALGVAVGAHVEFLLTTVGPVRELMSWNGSPSTGGGEGGGGGGSGDKDSGPRRGGRGGGAVRPSSVQFVVRLSGGGGRRDFVGTYEHDRRGRVPRHAGPA